MELFELPQPGRRIYVVGTSGSGKTTIASLLAQRLGLRHIEIDALHWQPGWVEAPTDELRARVITEIAGEDWVIDGNYGKVRDLILPRIDTIVWLDYPLPTIIARLLWRTMSRVVCREELWSGNRESLRTTFLSRDSILLWALSSNGRNRQAYTDLFGNPSYMHLVRVRLRSTRQARLWMAHLQPTPVVR